MKYVFKNQFCLCVQIIFIIILICEEDMVVYHWKSYPLINVNTIFRNRRGGETIKYLYLTLKTCTLLECKSCSHYGNRNAISCNALRMIDEESNAPM